jgi:hypothetical protein
MLLIISKLATFVSRLNIEQRSKLLARVEYWHFWDFVLSKEVWTASANISSMLYEGYKRNNGVHRTLTIALPVQNTNAL